MKLQDVHIYNRRQQQKYYARTGIFLDIQNIGKNTDRIAVKARKSSEEIYRDVWLRTDVLEFSDRNFTNVYDLFWNASKKHLVPVIHSEKYPYYLQDHIERDPLLLAVINGSFFFLVDFTDREPKDYPFHFCCRNNRVLGLPSSDEPIIFIREQKLYAREPNAIGTIKIAGTIISWVGSESKRVRSNKYDAILYNSGSAKLIKQFDPKTGVRIGMLDNSRIHTPRNKDSVDLVISNKKRELTIVDIVDGGGSHYFDGLFILQIQKSKNRFGLGDKVVPCTLDGIDLQSIYSGITVGKNVKDPFFLAPQRISSRDARSVIAEDVRGNIHFIVFDGSKYIPNFKGVSALDIAGQFSKDIYKWAYFLDGGSSSRIIVREREKYRFLANEFAFKKITNEMFLWDWKRHRRLASSIALRIQTD